MNNPGKTSSTTVGNGAAPPAIQPTMSRAWSKSGDVNSVADEERSSRFRDLGTVLLPSSDGERSGHRSLPDREAVPGQLVS
jgi:hypothetical protein